MTQAFPDIPKLLGRPDARLARQQELGASHIAPLTAFVRSLRTEAGPDAAVPDFDPWDGGVHAEVLFLLEAPGARAVESGFVSRNNPDETAKNFHELSREAELTRDRTLIWNAVPWYIGSGTKIRAAKGADVRAGLPSLRRLLPLVPRLRAIVLVGRPAQRLQPELSALRPTLRLFSSPHPSPLYVNRRPDHRGLLLAAWREVSTFLDDRLSAAV